MSPVAIALRPARIARFLGGIALLLVLANLAAHAVRIYSGYPTAWGLPSLFSLDQERNLPTVFNTLILVFAFLLLGTIATAEHLRRSPLRHFWMILGVGFLFMAADEAVSLHEKLDPPPSSSISSGSPRPAMLSLPGWSSLPSSCSPC